LKVGVFGVTASGTAQDAEASVDRLYEVLQNLAEIQLLADAAATAVDASDDPSGDASTYQ